MGGLFPGTLEESMRVFRFKSAALALSLLASAGFVAISPAPAAYAQSNISGDISGVVTDASGAIIPNAQVSVTSVARGDVKNVTTDAAGNFRVSLLSPGSYKVSIAAAGFQTATTSVSVSAGVITPVNIKMAIGQASTTIEVTGGINQVLHTEDAQISTSFDLSQIQSMPNPGNDLTFVAQTAPGAVMNTQGGYGNFSTNGLPATSNTFTINGGYEGDPYLNLNNSGATNLLLGNNDVDTVTVITNSYDAAFGGLGGAQVNEISRSGGNKWHGNMAYWWNGSVMNANSFDNKTAGSPKNFDNANQWAAAIGGPIKRDKIFGFVNTEGIRVIIPVRSFAFGPSPAFQAAVLAPAGAASATNAPYGNLADNGNSSEAAMYKTIFDYYNNAPGFSKGQIDPLGNDPNAWYWNAQTTNFGREWLITDRVDFHLTNSDTMYVHSKVDHGIQPTQTSFLNPIFNAESPQPSYEGQINETHTFSPNVTNQFLLGASYYRAIFTNTNGKNLGASKIPFALLPLGYATGSSDWDIFANASSWVGGADWAFPQGRNVTGYQANDDLNWIRGKHTLKFGYTFRRDDITDFSSSEYNSQFGGPQARIYDIGDFAAGYVDQWRERFPTRLSQPVAMYVSGAYVQDQYKPLPNLTLTIGLRLEHNSNPICRTNCVSNFSTDFASLPNQTSSAYNSILASGRKRAFLKQQNIAYEPRFGFSFLPGGPGSKTTIRGGFGMFADYFPAEIMGNLMTNLPSVDRFTVLGALYGNLTTLDPSQASSAHAAAVTSNTALASLYSKGACYKGCDPSVDLSKQTGGVFSRPDVVGTAPKIFLPTYEEWSFAIEREILTNLALAVNYVGNRSYHQPVANTPNAYWRPNDPADVNKTLPSTRPNAALSTVTVYNNGSYSNYNGVIATLTGRLKYLTTQFNYAYGHALDTTSNGGFNAFGVNPVGQINPYNLHQQYGNADYDTRHYISANYVVTIPHFGGPKVVVDDWQVAGTVFHNTGYPFSVAYGSGEAVYGSTPLAKQIDNNFNHHCGGIKHTTAYNVQCDFASHFTTPTDYGQQARNQLFGPNYTDFDMDIMKGFKLPHTETGKLTVGAQFFNVFNHPNFQIPTADITAGAANGVITTTANTPTSILGAFLGGDASPRLIQLKGTITF